MRGRRSANPRTLDESRIKPPSHAALIDARNAGVMSAEASAPRAASSPRVLVVEDEPKLSLLLCRGLAEASLPADAASTGEEALLVAGERAYDAVLLDLMLPGIGGFEVCRRLRAQGSAVPIVILTARWSLDERLAGQHAGADDFLLKPFSFVELVGRLRELTGRELSHDAHGPRRSHPALMEAWDPPM